MSYEIIPNIIFILSVFGILLIILRHLPEAKLEAENKAQETQAHQTLINKGLPAVAISKIKVSAGFAAKKAWNFILEAKDLKPHASTGYKMKKIFSAFPGIKKIDTKPIAAAELKNEQYYLDQIKQQPKNLTLYDALGKHYLEDQNYDDARDIYLYLTKHQPASPDFQARLAYCYYQSKDFSKAAEHYQKSLSLDSTQPNRYYNLGLSLVNSGKISDSIQPFEQAIALEPAAKFYVSLASAQQELGNLDQAREALKLALRLDPQNMTVADKLQKVEIIIAQTPVVTSNEPGNFTPIG